MKKHAKKYFIIFLFLYSYYLYTSLFNIFINKDYIVFLNAGQGDSILLASNGKYLLIDGGASSYSLNTLYRYTNYTFPKNILITHFHFDHISGLLSLLNNQSYYDIYISESSSKNKLYSKYFKNLTANNIKTVIQNDSIKLENLNIKVLWPPINCKNVDLNYCSVALLVKKGEKSALLLSDNPEEVQFNYKQYVDDNIEIIKVPHHGSVNSFNQSLLSNANLKYAVFTVGGDQKNILNSKVAYFYNKKALNGVYYTYNGDLIYFFE